MHPTRLYRFSPTTHSHSPSDASRPRFNQAAIPVSRTRRISHWRIIAFGIFGILLFIFSTALAQDPVWRPIPDADIPAARGLPSIRPPETPRFILNIPAIKAQLAAAPEEFPVDPVPQAHPCIIELPLPDNTSTRFYVTDSPVMAPRLARAYPEIKTYKVRGVDTPALSGRIDLTHQGFHAQISGPGGQWYIDPVLHLDPRFYTAYRRSDLARALVRPPNAFRCGCPGCGDDQPTKRANHPGRGGALGPAIIGEEPVVPEPPGAPEIPGVPESPAAPETPEAPSGIELRTFRLAVTATGEYTQFHGGTVADGLAATVTGINRVNDMYERDLAVRLLLVENNDQLIYTDADTDPFGLGDLFQENTDTINQIIGVENYDIGHNVNQQIGGLASLDAICSVTSKANGYSGDRFPINDPFWIDYVSHEIGHQFGALHTFNGTVGNCSGFNREGQSAFEPGSGSTIMAYAGICGSDNLQMNTDPYFHAQSIAEIQRTIDLFGACSVNIPTTNQPPVVNAGDDIAIPFGTPFTLTATATDENDGDLLTYCWEQFDLGPAQALDAADNGSSPLFRSLEPTPSPTRTFPRLATILANTPDPQEELPNQGRMMRFRCTARDNQTGGGGTAFDDIQVNVVSTAGPFRLLTGNTPTTLFEDETIRWDVAGTDLPPIDAQTVNILLSIDGGATFPIVLAESATNNGAAQVVMPDVETNAVRIKIEATDNVFFDINDVDIEIGEPLPIASFMADGAPMLIDNPAVPGVIGNNNQQLDPGEANLLLTLPIRNVGTTTATQITSILSTTNPGVAIFSDRSVYVDIPPGETDGNLAPFILSVGSSYACGLPLELRLEVSSAEGNSVIAFSIPSGVNETRTFEFNTFTSSDAPAVIPDSFASGVDIPIVVSGISSVISDLNFFIGGETCSTAAGAQGNGINHEYIGDLIISLTSPQGTRVTLMREPGLGLSEGLNLCQVVLDDQGNGDSIDNLPIFGPYAEIYKPSQPLEAFNGESPNGEWVVNVADILVLYTGDVRNVGLEILTATCTPPSEVNPDADSDGLPDDWEVANFGGVDSAPSDDPDSDGQDNLAEYIADTNPQDPDSILRLEVSPANPSVVRFITSPNRYYTIEALQDFHAGTWTQTGVPFQGTGTEFSFIFPDAPRRDVYRLRAQLAP